VVQSVVDAGVLNQINMDLGSLDLQGAGTRNLLDLAWCRSLAQTLRTYPVIAATLGESTVAVQCTYFDKNPNRNWRVAFHQDLAVPVSHRVDHPELTGWSHKEGQEYVQAPVSLLSRLMAVRLHLDPSTSSNGALRIIPGSHLAGRLSPAQVQAARASSEAVTVAAQPGDALLMRPLVLHASSKVVVAASRRVLHFLFGPSSPGFGLRWQNDV